MKKKFLSNLLLLVLLNILIKPFWFFGIEVAVQNRVGEEMYGLYFSLFNFAFILNILLDIGITNYNNRAVAREHDLLEREFVSNCTPEIYAQYTLWHYCIRYRSLNRILNYTI